MKIIVFNIENYKYYNGIEEEMNIYDKFYQEKKANNPVLYNFNDYNGFCYGYISLKKGVLNLSEIKNTIDNSIFMKNCLVVFVSKSANDDFTITGWYKNASVYNFLQKKLSYPSVGRDLYYNVCSKSTNCYLVPHNKRMKNIKINFALDNNFYMLDTDNTLYEDISSYINNYDDFFANTPLTADKLSATLENPPENPISLFKRGYIYVYEEGNILEGLKYFNTALLFKEKLEKKAIIDIHYFRAMCFQYLYSFENAKNELEIVLSFIGYDLNIVKTLIYLNMTTNNFDNAIKNCNEILNIEKNETQPNLILDEVLAIKAECLISLGNLDEAEEILNNIIKSSHIEPIISHCKNILFKLKL